MSDQQGKQPDHRPAYRANLAHWNEITPVHVRSPFYDVAGFLAGGNALHSFVTDAVGDVAEKSLLHLQCHFGLDTLSWTRLGASVTGVDFSARAIAQARKLAKQTDLPARFVVGNVLDERPPYASEGYDIVFTSFGALVWLGDLGAWAATVARNLKPGGTFQLFEFHPLLQALGEQRITRTSPPQLELPYFVQAAPMTWEPADGWDYADHSYAPQTRTYEWAHSLSEIWHSLEAAGLRITGFDEYPFCVYQARNGMVQGSDGLWRMPAGVPGLPLMFWMRAGRPH